MVKPFEVKSSKVIHETHRLSLYEDQLKLDDGTLISKLTVRHPGAVVILPQTASGSILFVRQYRHSIGKYLLELPAGTLEKGEEPLECAKREIQEEVGFFAKDWKPLGTLYPAPGFCDEIQHCYLARDLYPSSLPMDAGEVIEVEERSLDSVRKAIFSGDLSDAKSIATLVKAQTLIFQKV